MQQKVDDLPLFILTLLLFPQPLQALIYSHTSPPILSTYLLCQCASCICSLVEDRTLHGKVPSFTRDLTPECFLRATILAPKSLHLTLDKPLDPILAACLPGFVCATLCATYHLSAGMIQQHSLSSIPSRAPDVLTITRKPDILDAILFHEKEVCSSAVLNLFKHFQTQFLPIFSPDYFYYW